ncbi:MAG TPA: Clp protease N-terminal domain-containing protein [Gaiellaceae bacterium]
MVERFSLHCRLALAASEREARSLKHPHVATEHVLLGLLSVEDSVAAQALRLLGVTRRKARRSIVRLVDVGRERQQGALSFTPRVREIIEDAFSGSSWMPLVIQTSLEPVEICAPVSRAPRLRPGVRHEVRSEELLFALLAHGEGVAAHVLSGFDVDLAKLAVAIQRVRFSGAPATLFQAPSRWPPEPPKPA